MPDRYAAYPSLELERPADGVLRVVMAAPGRLNAAGHQMHRDLAGPARRRQRLRLAAGTAPPAGAHPVEWATYQLVATRPDHPRWALGAELCRAPAMAAVRERLQQGGLAPTPEQRTRYRATGLWFVPLLALGAARVAAGSANGRPVGFLVVALLVTVVTAAVLSVRVPAATALGKRSLTMLRAETRRPPAGLEELARRGVPVVPHGSGCRWARPANPTRRASGTYGVASLVFSPDGLLLHQRLGRYCPLR